MLSVVLVNHGSDVRYIEPAKSAEESTIRLLLADHDEESLTVYTDGFRANKPLEDDQAFTREYVVHNDGEYGDGEVRDLYLARRCESPLKLKGILTVDSHPVSTNSDERHHGDFSWPIRVLDSAENSRPIRDRWFNPSDESLSSGFHGLLAY